MPAQRNSVAKVTFQILFLQGQVFSERGATDLCAFLAAGKLSMGSKGNGSVYIMLASEEGGLSPVGTAGRPQLSVLPVLLPYGRQTGKQNPATLRDQRVLRLESRADLR